MPAAKWESWRKLGIAAGLFLLAVLDEADWHRVPEFGCELSAFHDEYLHCPSQGRRTKALIAER